jgi:hypothetical protein
MEATDLAYEIVITPILTYETVDRMRKVEAIQTKTMTYFRYIYTDLYSDYDEVVDVKFFLDKEEAISYWNEAVSREYSVISYRECLTAVA